MTDLIVSKIVIDSGTDGVGAAVTLEAGKINNVTITDPGVGGGTLTIASGSTLSVTGSGTVTIPAGTAVPSNVESTDNKATSFSTLNNTLYPTTQAVANYAQPIDATLTALAGLTIAADSLSIGTGVDAFTQTTFAANTFPAKSSTGNLVAKTISNFALTILDDADASAVRTTIGAQASGSYQPLDTQLTDLAGLSYTGNTLKVIRVNAGETGFELATVTAGSGDVVGPASATDSAIALFDTTTGKLLKNSSITVSGSTITGTLSGNASTATSAATLTTARNINGVSFNGSADITVTAAAGTLTGTTLASGVTASSLTSFGTTPTLVTPILGVATATSINGLTITSSTGTLTITNAKTLSVSNSLTLAGTDSTIMTFPSTSATIARTDAANTFTGASTATSWTVTTPTITFSTSATVTAGTNAQAQGALTSDYNIVTTTVANPSGVTLPTATTGRKVIVVNKGTNSINIYPAAGGTIDALSANASIALAVGSVIEFNASSTTQWYSSANQAQAASVLTGTTLNSTVTASSLTSFGTTPTLVTPILGTPTSGTLTNCTGYTDANLSTSDVTTNNFTTAKHGFVPKGTNVGSFLKDDGTWAAPSGSGDMILASAQTVTGAKTFNDTKLLLRNVANTFNGSFVNTNTADRIYTLPDTAGTVALTSTVINQVLTGWTSGSGTVASTDSILQGMQKIDGNLAQHKFATSYINASSAGTATTSGTPLDIVITTAKTTVLGNSGFTVADDTKMQIQFNQTGHMEVRAFVSCEAPASGTATGQLILLYNGSEVARSKNAQTASTSSQYSIYWAGAYTSGNVLKLQFQVNASKTYTFSYGQIACRFQLTN